ncbi:hypothetical protein [Nafulsella turpanensis]|uniref:hypothetical protein n=1 Tax=Nafulsella turpanensis TaxID=1265690 RepID=UPI00034CFC8F|nr:hypothetical protein [Nafulsella turpanensis]
MPVEIESAKEYWVSTNDKAILKALEAGPTKRLYREFNDLYLRMDQEKKSMLITFPALLSEAKRLRKFVQYCDEFTEALMNCKAEPV